MKASSTQLARIIRTLEAKGISYDLNGTTTKGSVYFRDPDGILLEITTGY
jgi:catechol 2,3-dioxygenase-like lactoylglutathione lyase family enzyme